MNMCNFYLHVYFLFVLYVLDELFLIIHLMFHVWIFNVYDYFVEGLWGYTT